MVIISTIIIVICIITATAYIQERIQQKDKLQLPNKL